MSGINLVGEQIKPLKVLVHKDIKNLWDDIVRAKSNTQIVNRESLLKSVEIMISDHLTANEIWNKDWEELDDQGETVLDASTGDPMPIAHWSTWTDDKLFTNLLQIISEDGVTFGTETSLHEKIAKRMQSLRLINIELLSASELSRFMSKFIEYTIKMGNTDDLTVDQIRSILKIAIQNLTVDRDTVMGRCISKSLRTDLEQALSSMNTFEDFRIKLTKLWTKAKQSITQAKQYGMVAPGNKSDNKNGNGKRIQSNSDHDKKPNKKPNTEQTHSHEKCTACGRSSHATSECKLVHFHPNVNKNRDIAFADTDQGKACLATFGKAELPFRKTIDNHDVDVPEQYLPKGNKKQRGMHIACNLNTITSIDSNDYPIITCNLIMYERKQPSQRVNISCPLVLIDSGALDANYIDEDFVNDLVHMYNITINKRSIAKISSALHDLTTYKTSKGTISLELIINNEQTNTHETITCSFRIVKLTKFNIILGIHTIKQYDLTLKYRSLFSTSNIKINREHSTTNDEEAVGEEYKRKNSYLTSSFSPNSTPAYMESTESVGSVAQGLNNLHVRDLLGESDSPDDLQLQQENDNVTTMTSQWDIYAEESTNPQNLNVENEIESIIPTNVHCAKERHILLFNKYKSIFSRTVNPEPAAVPPMTLQVDTSKWESRQHRLAPRYQSTIKHEEIKKQMKTMADLKVIQPSQATEWSQVTIAPKPNGKWRFCIDYKLLNLITKEMVLPYLIYGP